MGNCISETSTNDNHCKIIHSDQKYYDVLHDKLNMTNIYEIITKKFYLSLVSETLEGKVIYANIIDDIYNSECTINIDDYKIEHNCSNPIYFNVFTVSFQIHTKSMERIIFLINEVKTNPYILYIIITSNIKDGLKHQFRINKTFTQETNWNWNIFLNHSTSLDFYRYIANTIFGIYNILILEDNHCYII